MGVDDIFLFQIIASICTLNTKQCFRIWLRYQKGLYPIPLSNRHIKPQSKWEENVTNIFIIFIKNIPQIYFHVSKENLLHLVRRCFCCKKEWRFYKDTRIYVFPIIKTYLLMLEHSDKNVISLEMLYIPF
jgi:hypothetical protein